MTTEICKNCRHAVCKSIAHHAPVGIFCLTWNRKMWRTETCQHFEPKEELLPTSDVIWQIYNLDGTPYKP